MKIAVDIASADNPLEEIVGGAVDALSEHTTIEVVVVGDETRITNVLKGRSYDSSRITIRHTTEVIGMSESPATAVKQKKNSSLMIAAELVRSGEAAGFFSPGNTGATLAAALLTVGRLKGVDRPALVSPFPNLAGGYCYLLDAGANVDCTPEYLLQFALMGEVYAEHVAHIPSPRVGALNVGEEDSKGDKLVKDARELLRKAELNFIGNVEPLDIFTNNVDVVTADGFVGNIVLKTTEAVAKAVVGLMKQSIKKSPLRMAGAALMNGVFSDLKNLLNADAYGGVPLLGVKGGVVIGHGHSSEAAVKNGILACARYSEAKVSEHIVEKIARHAG